MLDLAVSDVFGEINVLRGNGAGGFGATTTLRTTSVTGIGNLVALSAVDVNGDGRPDLVATSSGGEVVTLLNLSAAPGTFTVGGIAAAPGASTGLVVDTTAHYVSLIRGTSAGETLFGDAGQNVIYARDGDDTVRGFAGDDELSGDGGNDILYGDEGADLLKGGLGADRMVGGADDDTYAVDDVGDVVVERAGGGYDRVVAALDWTLGSELERLSLSGTADLKATGNELANRLDGNAGANVLEGGDGNDALYGGAGNDIANYADATAGVAVNLMTGRASGGDGTDTLDSIEGVWGSAFNDTLTGDASANGLEGFDGSDRLNGRAGDDSLDGGLGADSALYINASAAVVVDLAAGTATGGDGNDTLSNIENLYGSSFDDTLSGDGGVNVLYGQDGNDLLVGAAGNDRLKGEAGNDRLMGEAGNDSLLGDAGEDTLVGGEGSDSLFGGAGGDSFRFEAVADSMTGARDRIVDFEQGLDHISLTNIDANTVDAGDQSFAFIGSAGFSDTAGELRVVTRATATIVQGDVDGNGAADFQFVLTGAHTLLSSDFIL